MARFFEWTPDSPGVVHDTTVEARWDELASLYSPLRRDQPLDRVLSIARELGVASVLVEHRYIDLDYRSEHSHFYSTTFRRYPSVSHRLHFFTDKLEGDLSNLDQLSRAYRGYSVMRPLENSPVGRTVISPPPELDGATVCAVTDKVNVFGVQFKVTGVPFISQDEQYLRCAHAAQWMVLYHAHLLHGLPRSLPGDIHEASLGGLSIGRQIPSDGLTYPQMLNGLNARGLSPGLAKLPGSKEASRRKGYLSLFAILCRHVNSNLPPIVASESHAWVVVAYRLLPGDGRTHDRIRLYRHDDARGPYLPVDDPWGEPESDHRPWDLAITPLPRKLYMSGERAEHFAVQAVEWAANTRPDLRRRLDENELTYRTYAIASNDFKTGLSTRTLPDVLRQAYCLAQWPRYIWVIEVLDRARRDAGQAATLGEVIVDGTAHDMTRPDQDPSLLALHLLGEVAVATPDHDRTTRMTVESGPYESGCPSAQV